MYSADGNLRENTSIPSWQLHLYFLLPRPSLHCQFKNNCISY